MVRPPSSSDAATLVGLARRGTCLPSLPPPGRLARGAGRRPAATLPGRGLLGSSGVWLRGPGSLDRDSRPGAGSPRRQPHRADVHRRPLRRLALCRPAPRRLRQPGRVAAPRRRIASAGRLRHRRRALRASRQQARPVRARQLPPLPRPRAGPARSLPNRRRARLVRLGRRPAGAARAGPDRLPGRSLASATAPGPRWATGACSAATTRASRTPSPAGSPSRCWTRCSPAPASLPARCERRRGFPCRIWISFAPLRRRFRKPS